MKLLQKLMNLRATVEAKQLFPLHSEVQEIWIKLRALNGGIEEAVEYLDMYQEFEEYNMRFDEALKTGKTKYLVDIVFEFNLLCRDRLLEKFKINQPCNS
jgi:hypothetical protein